MYKKLVLLTSYVLVVSVTVSTVNANITEGLVGHWPLTDGAGTIAVDRSGNGNDGIIEGNPIWISDPVRGGTVMVFDGVDDRINFGPLYTLQSNSWSFSLWFKTPPSDDRIPLVGKNDASGGFNAGEFDIEITGNGTWGSIIDPEPAGNLAVNAHSQGGAVTNQDVISLDDDTWHHGTVVHDESAGATNITFYIDGVAQPAGSQTFNNNSQGDVGDVYLGFANASGSGAEGYFTGSMSGLRLYDRALTPEEVTQIIATQGKPWPYAFGPRPEDGSLYENTWANLTWNAGDFAVSHDLYFGTSFDDVNDGAEGTFVGNLGVTTQVVGFFGFPAPDGLQPGTTYYWRVDEVNDANTASPWKGDVWSFSIPPQTAYDGSPADGAANVLQDVTLNWTPGMGASLHHVYFGDNLDEVSSAVGAPPLTEAVFIPAALEVEKTYYWRVDEFDSTGTTHRGDIWSFTTVPDVAVTNPNLMLWWTLDEAEGATAVDWSGHGNHGGLNGQAQWIDGYQGTALMFGADDYVEAAGYAGITGTAARTLCAWIRTTEANRTIMSWAQNTAGKKWRMRSDATGGLRVEVNGGYNYGATNIADGRWHHVAVTFEDDGTPDVLDTLLYVDGQPEATAASLDEPVDTDATGAVRIGKSAYHTSGFIGVIDDARIYDKVLTAEEIQQVMLGDTTLAGNPVPERNAVVDIRDISSLSWSAGDGAASHDVYFGTDRDTLEFKGNQAGTSLSLADMVEFGGGDYYWRIDEVATDGTVTAGTTWTFTVPDYLIVEGFESYNDLAEDDPASNRIYLTWIDGFGTTTNGAVAGNLDVPLMAPGRNSAQAMPVSYDNAGKTSEVTKTLTSGKDWTEQGVTKLVVWFSGDAANAADRMFVALGNAVVYHPDDAATQDSGWNEWVIELQEFANQGANLANVGSITLGFGTRNAPVATGGIGTVEFEDIGLIR